MSYFSRETGFMTLMIGFAIFILGAMLLFDKALIIAGNLLLIAGILIVFQTNASYFFKLERMQGTLMFALGIVVMCFKYTLLGFILEIFGLLQLFKKSLPDFRTVLTRYMFGKSLIKKD